MRDGPEETGPLSCALSLKLLLSNMTQADLFDDADGGGLGRSGEPVRTLAASLK